MDFTVKKGSGEGFSEGVLRRGPAMDFTVKKGSGEEFSEGVLRRGFPEGA